MRGAWETWVLESCFIASRLNTKAINLHVLRRVYIVTQLVFDEKKFSSKLNNERVSMAAMRSFSNDFE